MADFGFDTALGFVSPTLEQLKEDYAEKYFQETGILIDQGEASPTRDDANTIARMMKAVWDDVAGVYGSGFVGTSQGAALRNLLLPFIGEPIPDTASTVVLPLAGVAATVVPAGSTVLLDTDGPNAAPWVLEADVVIPGDGTFAYSVPGPKTAAASSTWTIGTPVFGWASAGPNVAPASVGRLAETDIEYRQRFAASVVGTILVARVAAVDGVTNVTVFENQTDIPDSFWGATHWVELLVEGGDNTDIANAIHPAGRTYSVQLLGDTTVTVPDAATPSGTFDVRFSRPNLVDVWCELTITKGEGYSSDTSAAAIAARELAIRNQILAWAALRSVGLDVTAFQVAAIAAATPTVPGIANITATVGLVNPPVDASVVAEVRDLLVFDAARILLNGV